MKIKKQFVCSCCGNVSQKWSGQCYACLEWNSISEEVISSIKDNNNLPLIGEAQKILSLDNIEKTEDNLRIKTSIEELNKVLGDGLVVSSSILIGGDPGIGKSTLLLQLASSISSLNIKSLYITGEESIEQITLRAKRLAVDSKNTLVTIATKLEDIIATIEKLQEEIKIVIIDSIQMISSIYSSSAAGSVAQIRISAQQLINYTKGKGISLILACHVTKDGLLAGPKILEHLVDTVLYFEGDNNHHYRILRSVKNRFGAINEIGVFEMSDKGLIEVSNPSKFFLTERKNNVSGNTIFAGIEGSRPFLIEVQALIASSSMPTPRRFVVGWDLNRLSMIIAVLAARARINLLSYEIYLSIVGGIKINEPAADLAVAASLISACKNLPVPEGTVFFGEIGLSGEIRKVHRMEERIKEALKLGFNKIICADYSSSKQQAVNNKSIIYINHLRQLESLLSN